jgi:hypothetical protein
LVTPDEAVIPDDGQAARTGSGMKLATNIKIGGNIVLLMEVYDRILSPCAKQYIEQRELYFSDFDQCCPVKFAIVTF